MPFATAAGAGVRLAVRLTPRAARDGLDGVAAADAEGRAALRLRVAAPPVDGAANAALVGYVAASLGLRKSDVAIVSGERGRLKLLELSGDPDALLARLAEWVGGGRGR
ncbi:DUF167 domain-containing protein [Craurococcus roseus]|uniref:DUF167 domain-containing protein n=1 Tax=Craurococcus roseus TaxID=77585 RepID=UPI0031CF1EDD